MTTLAPAPPPDALRSRWTLVYGWAAGLAAYWIAVLLANERAVFWINDIAWTLAAAIATVAAVRTGRAVEGPRRRAWLLLACGCTSWFLGQMYWNYNQLVLNVELPFPTIGQVFYSGFAVLAIAAVLQLPSSRRRSPFTFKKVGNIGLVTCCLAVTIVLGVLEPGLQYRVPALHLTIALLHTTLVAATFLAALYALWTYSWGVGWTTVLLLTIAACIYAVSNVIYAHSLLTGAYLPDDFINVSWLVVFGLISIAASEQVRQPEADDPGVAQRIQVRERWLEAIIPALLIIIMVAVAVSSAATLTTRAGYWAAALFIVFAVMLGAREAWIKNESQQLTAQLIATNEQLQATNAELRRSEVRYRELNAALEQRVAERTAQLKSAYEELEGFSYAVAHDLKAPLRAINGFAHLLEAEIDRDLTSTARDQLTRIRQGSVKMATLIDDLLAYSHIDRRGLQPSLIVLPTLLDAIVGHHADEIQRRSVSLALSIEAITMRTDAEGLALALRNLFENALKYTRDQAHPRIEIAARRDSSGVHLTFTDNGIGFDMEYHDHIFKIFQRLHRDDQYPGTGIGLALVRKAAERIGGRVWGESRVGEGATFHLELPAMALDDAGVSVT